MPEIDSGHFYRSIFASWLGHHKEAVAAARRGVAISFKDPNALSILSYALARDGQKVKARQLADRARAATGLRPAPLFLAASYVALGEEAIALALLQEARDIKSPWFAQAAYDPRLESLRGTPEFRALFDIS